MDSDNADVTLLPDTMFVRLLDDSLHDALSTDDPSSDPIFSTTSDTLNGLCLPPMKSALSDWKIVDSILYYKDCAYVSPTACHNLLHQLHDHPMAGHPGHFKTEELVNVKVVLKRYWIRRALASAHTLCPFPEYSPLFQITILIVSEGPDDYHMISGYRDK